MPHFGELLAQIFSAGNGSLIKTDTTFSAGASSSNALLDDLGQVLLDHLGLALTDS